MLFGAHYRQSRDELAFFGNYRQCEINCCRILALQHAVSAQIVLHPIAFETLACLRFAYLKAVFGTTLF